MEAMIADAIAHEAVLMSLRASEAVIYGRYGFGVAGEYTEAAIDTARARPVSGGAKDGSIRLLRPDEIHDTVRPIYERAAHRRPGIVSRPDSWWERYLRDAVTRTKSSYVVIHVDGHGTPDGYAHYDVAWNDDGSHGGKGEVHDIFGTTDAVELALWTYLVDMDLVRTWKAEERPLDDILRAAVNDRRAYSTKSVDDEQWIRIVDVDATLRGPHVQRRQRLGVDRRDRPAGGGEQRRVGGRRKRCTTHARRGRSVRRHQCDLRRLPRRHGVAHAGSGGRGGRAQREGGRDRGQPVCQPPAPVQRQFLLTPRDACRVAVAWLHQAELVRRDHGVHTRPNVELEQHAGDV